VVPIMRRAGRSFTATAITHTITASAGSHGSVSPSGAVSVVHGANQQFTFAGDTGYHVTQVLVDGSPVSTTSPYTFTNVTADHTIAVAFAINTYTISVSTTTPQACPPCTYTGGGTFDHGSHQDCVFHGVTDETDPENPVLWGLNYITVDGVYENIMGNPHTVHFPSLDANHTLVVGFTDGS
jgi:hypothetical protein